MGRYLVQSIQGDYENRTLVSLLSCELQFTGNHDYIQSMLCRSGTKALIDNENPVSHGELPLISWTREMRGSSKHTQVG